MTDRIDFSPASLIQSRLGLGRLARWIGIGAIAAGALQTLACAAVLVRTSAWLSRTTTAEGTVVAHEAASPAAAGARAPHGGRTATVVEVVRFRDADGIERRFTSSIATSHPFAPDAPVTVRYRPDAPDDARIDTFFRIWGLPLVLAGGGLVMVGFGVVFLRAGQRAVHA